jgi:hypothetical protein
MQISSRPSHTRQLRGVLLRQISIYESEALAH